MAMMASQRGTGSEPYRRSALPPRCLTYFCNSRCLAERECLLRCGGGKQMHHARHDSAPSRLVAGAETRSVIGVKVFVEKNIVAPVRILLELPGGPVDRPAAVAVAHKNICQAAHDLLRDLIERHLP